MKKILLSLLLAAPLLMINSCTTEYDTNPQPQEEEPFDPTAPTANDCPLPNDFRAPLSCVIGSNIFRAETSFYSRVPGPLGNTVTIRGSMESTTPNRILSIIIANYQGKGGYDLVNPYSGTAYYQPNLPTSTIFNSNDGGEGRVCVTFETTDSIGGYFYFKGKNPIENEEMFTNGYFRMSKR